MVIINQRQIDRLHGSPSSRRSYGSIKKPGTYDVVRRKSGVQTGGSSDWETTSIARQIAESNLPEVEKKRLLEIEIQKRTPSPTQTITTSQIRQGSLAMVSAINAPKNIREQIVSRVPTPSEVIRGKRINLISSPRDSAAYIISKIRKHQQKRIAEPSTIQKANIELSKKVKEVTPKGTSKGWSITQKYMELLSRGAKEERKIKFYKSGERQQITKDTLKELNAAKDYGSQQKAIEKLRAKGINVKIENDSYVIDTSKIAPTSKWGNILVSATDLFIKGKIFAPYLTTGAAQKTERVAKKKSVKEKTETTSGIKFKGVTDEQIENYLRNVRAKAKSSGGKQYLRESFGRALRSGDKKVIDTSKKILEETLGKEEALKLISEVRTQEGVDYVSSIIETPQRTKLTLEFEIGEIFQVPILKKVPEIITTASIFTTPVRGGEISGNLFKENKFSGTAPGGKIGELDVGKISPLGDLGRIKEGTAGGSGSGTRPGITTPVLKAPQKEKEIQAPVIKPITKQPQITQPRLSQPQSQTPSNALLLSSLLAQRYNQALRQGQLYRQTLKQKSGIGTGYPFGFGLPEGGKYKLTPSLLGKIKQAYEVRVRREGAFRTIAKGLPKGKALKLGAGRVTQTLAATFKIVPKGFTTKTDVKFKPSKLRFRKPKSGEKLTFVEIKTKRIKKGTAEIGEILKIRGSKPWKRGKKRKKLL